MNDTEFPPGTLLRNTVSGNLGEVVDDPRTYGAKFVKVQVVKQPAIKYKVYWNRENVQIVNNNPKTKQK